MQGEVNIRIPMTAGIAGEVATGGKTANIIDAYLDKRFNQEVDEASGYRTRSILCMPIMAGKEVVGVIQLLNKNEGHFGAEDEEVMSSFLSIAGPILKSSNLSGKTKKSKGDSENQGFGDDGNHGKRETVKQPMLPAFGEGDDEEEEGNEGGF